MVFSSLKALDDILTNARAAQDAEGELFCVSVKCNVTIVIVL